MHRRSFFKAAALAALLALPALAAGPVHEFRRWRPPLTELYRDVVQAGTP